jgi:TetR/AcrR family transcriptional regulator, transcriptional repressor for nem operon
MTVLPSLMGKISNRDRILTEGLRVVHAQGFTGASVRDIVNAAGVPQGSFTNHFASKEAFGLEILNLYYDNARTIIAATLLDDSVPPLQRIRKWVGTLKSAVEHKDIKTGCMFGNFSAEATNCDGVIRLRLSEIFSELQTVVLGCLKTAVADKDLPPDFDVDGAASFVVSSLQGAILLSKAHRNVGPLDHFEQILFSKVLV